jgi:hypothetical protein
LARAISRPAPSGSAAGATLPPWAWPWAEAPVALRTAITTLAIDRSVVDMVVIVRGWRGL